MVKMKYVAPINFTFTGTSPTEIWEFRATSIFDPDYTGIGGQPWLHDQIGTFWKHYEVVAARLSISGLHSHDTPILVTFSVFESADTATISTATSSYTMLERGYGLKRYRFLPKASTFPYKSVKGSCTVKNLARYYERGADPLDYQADFGYNPVGNVHIQIAVTTEVGTNLTTGKIMDVNATLEQWVRVSEAKSIGAS